MKTVKTMMTKKTVKNAKTNKRNIHSKNKRQKTSKKKVKFNLSANSVQSFEDEVIDDQSNDDQSIKSGDGIDEGIDESVQHKQSLLNLQQSDPEFYEFLQQNDRQLLSFNEDLESVDDVEEDEDIEDEETKDETDLESVHNLNKLTVEDINEWSKRLEELADIESIKWVIKAFRSAVNETSGDSQFQLESSQVFNTVVNVCFVELLPAIHKFLRLPPITESKVIDPTKSRNWKKLMSIMKCYLTDIIKFLNVVCDSSVRTTVLRHILHLIPFLLIFPHLIKRLLKQAICLWSESEEKVRVISFLCILRILRNQERPMISYILKKMYISYVKNCKFTSESNWPLINFMKQSLVELYSLDEIVAYQHSFVFIKQLAINLRTAITVKKKESFKTVYNWQYLHSVLLWSLLLSLLIHNEDIKLILCPLINVIIGTIKLVPSAKFFPLRFHLIRALIQLSDNTNTFIPILPLITEVLDHIEYNNKQKPKEKKSLNFESIIKVSKLYTNDNEFRNSAIYKVNESILYYTSTQSHRIGFPELVLVSLIKIKKFLKSCSLPQHLLQLLKQLVDKIEENSRIVSDKRKNVTFSVTDSIAIESWERQLKEDGTPLAHHRNQCLKSTNEDNTIN